MRTRRRGCAHRGKGSARKAFPRVLEEEPRIWPQVSIPETRALAYHLREPETPFWASQTPPFRILNVEVDESLVYGCTQVLELMLQFI